MSDKRREAAQCSWQRIPKHKPIDFSTDQHSLASIELIHWFMEPIVN